MVDYGMVSLLLIQLAACAGTIVAWLRMRKEADGIVRASAEKAGAMGEMDAVVHACRTSVTTFETRLSSLESDIGKAVRAAEHARDGLDGQKGEIRSLKASIAAKARWAREDDDAAATDTPPLDTVLSEPQKSGTFGKVIR